MQFVVTIILVSMLGACNFTLSPPSSEDRNTASGNQISETDDISRHALNLVDEPLGHAPDCQTLASNYADDIVAAFGVTPDTATGSVTRRSDDACDIAVSYYGGLTLKYVTQGAANRFWFDPWEFSSLEECEADRARQIDLYKSTTRGLVLSDSCFLHDFMGVKAIAYQIRAIVPDPQPYTVKSFQSFEETSTQMFAKISQVLTDTDSIVFRSVDGYVAAYVPTERLVQIPFFDEPVVGSDFYGFEAMDDCELTLDRINGALAARYQGGVLDRECRRIEEAGNEYFVPHFSMFTMGTQLSDGYATSRWSTTFSACTAAADAADAENPGHLYVCLQETQGPRRFVVADMLF